MATSKLTQLLERLCIPHESVPHPLAYTAKHIAHIVKLSERTIAKTVIVRVDGELIMIVLPAVERVNLDQLKMLLSAETVELAKESEFMNLFPDCDVGAMIPFGNRCQMKVYITPTLALQSEIAVRAGSHRELVKLSYKDFERLTGVATLLM